MKMKSILLTAALAANLAAPTFANEVPASAPVQLFSETDTQMLFTQDAKPMQLAALSQTEMKETEGAWVWWAAAGVAGGGLNTLTYIGSNSNWTYGGAGYAFFSGASGSLIATLPAGNLARLGWGAVGGYTANQPWGGYSWSRW